MKKPYVVPNIITAMGLSIGLFVLFKAALSEGHGEARALLFKSALLILAAACIDVLDGFAARRLKGESLFGMNFDSLSDAITFGVAPAVLVLKTAPVEPKTVPYFLTFWAAMLFSLCGILRLVRFNVASIGEANAERGKIYTGLPIPAAAMAAISMQFFFANSFIEEKLGSGVTSYMAAGLMILLSYLMISLKSFRSLKWIQKERLDFSEIFLIASIVLTLLFGFMYHFDWCFFFVTWTYVLGGVLKGAASPTFREVQDEIG